VNEGWTAVPSLGRKASVVIGVVMREDKRVSGVARFGQVAAAKSVDKEAGAVGDLVAVRRSVHEGGMGQSRADERTILATTTMVKTREVASVFSPFPF